MTFIINGIKEGLEKKENIECILGMDSLLLAKKFLEDKGIITLSIKEYKDPGESYGKIVLQINYQEQSFSIWTRFEGTLQEACNFYMMAGFDIVRINDLNAPLSEEESQAIITQSKKENQERQEQEKKKKEQQIEGEKKIFEDPRLAEDKKAIERIFERMHKIIELTKGFVSGKDLKKLRDKEDELKKLKLGTNHERIVELVEEMTKTLETIENEYYDANTEQEKNIFENSIVTDIDITRQVNKAEKVQQLKSIGGKIPATEQEYELFGKSIIFGKILLKDFLFLFQNQEKRILMMYNTYDIIELILITVLICIPVYNIADTIFLFSGAYSYDMLYTNMIKIGTRWILLFGARKIRKKKTSILIGLIPAIILLYVLVFKLISNNFSL